MSDQPTASGADLARQALAAARAAAKTAPPAGAKKNRRTMRTTRGAHADPQGLGHILEKLTGEQGWEGGLGGGSLIDQWPTICPTELATTVRPVSYDPDHGLLTVRPSSAAYATQVRLFERSLVQHLNQRLGRPAVRRIRVLAAGATTPEPGPEPAAAQELAPVRTRETASAGYRATLEAHLAHRPDGTSPDGYEAAARRRQEQAMTNPAYREPETAFTDAVDAQHEAAAPAVSSSERSRRAALAYKHSGKNDAPRQAFDVA